MVAIPVVNTQGKSVGSYELDTTVLSESISKQLLHDVVVMYEANQRLGTVKTKTRGEVAYSTKKLYRQKGTGRARAGSRKSGVRRGGGHIHALAPRDWSYRMNKKAVRTALRMAMLSKIQDGELVLLDGLAFDEPGTKAFLTVLRALGLEGSSVLVGTSGDNGNVYLSARNLQNVTVRPVTEFNVYEVLRPKRVVLTTAGLEAFVAQARRLREGRAADTADQAA